MFWVEAKVLKDKWSFDAAVGYAMRNSLFVRNEMVCTKTLYNYLHQGLLRVKASDVKETLESWLQSLETVSDISALCKIITADNGREFADIDISTLENEDLSIFFAHPYSPGERGSNERHNGLLRRFIPKGIPIKDVSEATLQRALNWCNNLPRKLLHYKTPQEVFIEEINKVMDLESVQFHIAI